MSKNKDHWWSRDRGKVETIDKKSDFGDEIIARAHELELDDDEIAVATARMASASSGGSRSTS